MSVSASLPTLPSWGPLGQTWLGPHPLCRGARVRGVVDYSRGGVRRGGGASQCCGQGLNLPPALLAIPGERFLLRDTPQAGLLHLQHVAGGQHQYHERRQLPRYQQGQPPSGRGHSCDGRSPGLGTEGMETHFQAPGGGCDGPAADLGSVGWSLPRLLW